MVLDYVRIRFPSQDVKHVVEDILKIRLDVMIHEDFGFYSYSEHYVLGDVFVLTSPDEEKGKVKTFHHTSLQQSVHEKVIPAPVLRQKIRKSKTVLR